MSEPLRVLHVIDSFGHGGAEQNLLTMLGELQEGFEHHLLSLYPDDRLRDAFSRVSASLECLEVGGTRALPLAVAKLAQRIRAHRIEVVSAQLLRSQTVARVAAALTRRPIVVTWQNTSYAESSLSEFGHSRAKRLVSLGLDRLTAVRDAATIAVSNTVRDDNCARLGRSPDEVHVIPNAVGSDRLVRIDAPARERLRAELGGRPSEPLLLSVGRLVAQKAHADAIRAMPEILKARPTAKYFIAGQGPLHGELEALITTLGLTDSVRLLGPRRDVPALLQSCDAFLFPSLFEGLPVALVEAIATGARCIASDIPQNREAAVGCTEVQFFAVKDPSRLARAVLAGLESRGDRAADQLQAQQRFGARSVAAALASVLRSAARG